MVVARLPVEIVIAKLLSVNELVPCRLFGKRPAI